LDFSTFGRVIPITTEPAGWQSDQPSHAPVRLAEPGMTIEMQDTEGLKKVSLAFPFDRQKDQAKPN